MSGQELVSRFAAAFEAGDAVGLGSLYAEDATFDHPFFGHLTGRDVIVAHETPMFDAFTEISIAVHSVSQDGNKVAWEWTVDATHTGAMPLPDGGAVQPTGIRISQPGVEVAYLDDDGLITEGHRYQDGAAFLGQLGLG